MFSRFRVTSRALRSTLTAHFTGRRWIAPLELVTFVRERTDNAQRALEFSGRGGRDFGAKLRYDLEHPESF
jgi:hypothetical protein